ncbi:hypothetical protein VNI00_000246 [Paramarasmius palmivorus]|uniref:Uncharacterized protein n=1 Tax=Paramarasmius palmivorus TaxID=297713 RepID=A0AAW0EEE9_9AGAR
MGPLLSLLLPIWVEAIGYGLFLCSFAATVYIHFSDVLRFSAGPRSSSSRANASGLFNPFTALSEPRVFMQAMLFVSTLMFIVATVHLGVGTYRLFKDYIDVPILPILVVSRWDNLLITSLYVTQELLGSGAALYRCWVLWNMSWQVVMIPTVLFLGELAIGYVPIPLFRKSDLAKGISDPRIFPLITSFYTLTVVTNIITTGLIAYRLWSTHRKSYFITTRSVLVPIMWILVESAMLQLVVEAILLCLFLVNSPTQYVFWGLVVPLIGVTFTAITIRIKFVSAANSYEPSFPTGTSSSGIRYPRRSEGSRSRRVEIFTDVTNEDDMFRTSDFYKTGSRTQLSTGDHSRIQQG